MKKPLRETRVGQWLAREAPEILAGIGDVIPDAGLLGLISRIISKDDDLAPEKRLEFRQLLADEEAEILRATTARWVADASSDSKLAQNVRPVCLLVTLFGFFAVIFLDALEGVPFNLDPALGELLEVLAFTIFGAYFAGRSVEKSTRKK